MTETLTVRLESSLSRLDPSFASGKLHGFASPLACIGVRTTSSCDAMIYGARMPIKAAVDFCNDNRTADFLKRQVFGVMTEAQ